MVCPLTAMLNFSIPNFCSSNFAHVCTRQQPFVNVHNSRLQITWASSIKMGFNRARTQQRHQQKPIFMCGLHQESNISCLAMFNKLCLVLDFFPPGNHLLMSPMTDSNGLCKQYCKWVTIKHTLNKNHQQYEHSESADLDKAAHYPHIAQIHDLESQHGDSYHPQNLMTCSLQN